MMASACILLAPRVLPGDAATRPCVCRRTYCRERCGRESVDIYACAVHGAGSADWFVELWLEYVWLRRVVERPIRGRTSGDGIHSV